MSLTTSYLSPDRPTLTDSQRELRTFPSSLLTITRSELLAASRDGKTITNQPSLLHRALMDTPAQATIIRHDVKDGPGRVPTMTTITTRSMNNIIPSRIDTTSQSLIPSSSASSSSRTCPIARAAVHFESTTPLSTHCVNMDIPNSSGIIPQLCVHRNVVVDGTRCVVVSSMSFVVLQPTLRIFWKQIRLTPSTFMPSNISPNSSTISVHILPFACLPSPPPLATSSTSASSPYQAKCGPVSRSFHLLYFQTSEACRDAVQRFGDILFPISAPDSIHASVKVRLEYSVRDCGFVVPLPATVGGEISSTQTEEELVHALTWAAQTINIDKITPQQHLLAHESNVRAGNLPSSFNNPNSHSSSTFNPATTTAPAGTSEWTPIRGREKLQALLSASAASASPHRRPSTDHRSASSSSTNILHIPTHANRDHTPARNENQLVPPSHEYDTSSDATHHTATAELHQSDANSESQQTHRPHQHQHQHQQRQSNQQHQSQQFHTQSWSHAIQPSHTNLSSSSSASASPVDPLTVSFLEPTSAAAAASMVCDENHTPLNMSWTGPMRTNFQHPHRIPMPMTEAKAQQQSRVYDQSLPSHTAADPRAVSVPSPTMNSPQYHPSASSPSSSSFRSSPPAASAAVGRVIAPNLEADESSESEQSRMKPFCALLPLLHRFDHHPTLCPIPSVDPRLCISSSSSLASLDGSIICPHQLAFLRLDRVLVTRRSKWKFMKPSAAMMKREGMAPIEGDGSWWNWITKSDSEREANENKEINSRPRSNNLQRTAESQPLRSTNKHDVVLSGKSFALISSTSSSSAIIGDVGFIAHPIQFSRSSSSLQPLTDDGTHNGDDGSLEEENGIDLILLMFPTSEARDRCSNMYDRDVVAVPSTTTTPSTSVSASTSVTSSAPRYIDLLYSRSAGDFILPPRLLKSFCSSSSHTPTLSLTPTPTELVHLLVSESTASPKPFEPTLRPTTASERIRNGLHQTQTQRVTTTGLLDQTERVDRSIKRLHQTSERQRDQDAFNHNGYTVQSRLPSDSQAWIRSSPTSIAMPSASNLPNRQLGYQSSQALDDDNMSTPNLSSTISGDIITNRTQRDAHFRPSASSARYESFSSSAAPFADINDFSSTMPTHMPSENLSFPLSSALLLSPTRSHIRHSNRLMTSIPHSMDDRETRSQALAFHKFAYPALIMEYANENTDSNHGERQYFYKELPLDHIIAHLRFPHLDEDPNPTRKRELLDAFSGDASGFITHLFNKPFFVGLFGSPSVVRRKCEEWLIDLWRGYRHRFRRKIECSLIRVDTGGTFAITFLRAGRVQHARVIYDLTHGSYRREERGRFRIAAQVLRSSVSNPPAKIAIPSPRRILRGVGLNRANTDDEDDESEYISLSDVTYASFEDMFAHTSDPQCEDDLSDCPFIFPPLIGTTRKLPPQESLTYEMIVDQRGHGVRICQPRDHQHPFAPLDAPLQVPVAYDDGPNISSTTASAVDDYYQQYLEKVREENQQPSTPAVLNPTIKGRSPASSSNTPTQSKAQQSPSQPISFSSKAAVRLDFSPPHRQSYSHKVRNVADSSNPNVPSLPSSSAPDPQPFRARSFNVAISPPVKDQQANSPLTSPQIRSSSKSPGRSILSPRLGAGAESASFKSPSKQVRIAKPEIQGATPSHRHQHAPSQYQSHQSNSDGTAQGAILPRSSSSSSPAGVDGNFAGSISSSDPKTLTSLTLSTVFELLTPHLRRNLTSSSLDSSSSIESLESFFNQLVWHAFTHRQRKSLTQTNGIEQVKQRIATLVRACMTEYIEKLRFLSASSPPTSSHQLIHHQATRHLSPTRSPVDQSLQMVRYTPSASTSTSSRSLAPLSSSSSPQSANGRLSSSQVSSVASCFGGDVSLAHQHLIGRTYFACTRNHQRVEQWLKKQKQDCTIVRLGSQESTLSLSFVVSGKVQHVRLRFDVLSNYFHLIGQHATQDVYGQPIVIDLSSHYWASIPELISSNIIYRFPPLWNPQLRQIPKPIEPSINELEQMKPIVLQTPNHSQP